MVQRVFVGTEGRIVDVSLLRVASHEGAQEKSIGNRHGSSTAEKRSKAIWGWWRFGPLSGSEYWKSTTRCSTVRGLAVMVENVGICLGGLLSLPARTWGVGHEVRVFSWSLRHR